MFCNVIIGLSARTFRKIKYKLFNYLYKFGPKPIKCQFNKEVIMIVLLIDLIIKSLLCYVLRY